MLKKILPAIFFVFLFLTLPAPVYAGEVLSCEGIECFPLYVVLAGPYHLVMFLVLFIIIRFIFKRLKVYQIVLFSLLIPFIVLLVYFQVITPLVEMSRVNDKSKTIAKQIDAPLYKPRYTPKGSSLVDVGAMDGFATILYFKYDSDSSLRRWVLLESKKPDSFDFNPPYCETNDILIFDFSSISSSYFEGSCEEIVTPKGVKVYTAKHNDDRNIAFVDLGETLGIVYMYEFSDDELLMFIDSLEKISIDEISFQRDLSNMR